MVHTLQPPDVVGHGTRETHSSSADDSTSRGGQAVPEAHGIPTAPAFLPLRILAEVFEDLQKQRIATTNRAERGGIDPEYLAPALERLEAAEHYAGLVLHRQYRSVAPRAVRDWQKATVGVGEHLLARLLGVIGHPVHTTVYEWQGEGSERVLVEVGRMDRTVSQLWSYCGHGDPTRKRSRGMTADEALALGSPRAKTIVHLIAESCMKQRTSPYRAVYDDAREQYEDRDWTPLHRHNAALRKVGKAMLKDLWLAAKDGE